MYIYTHIYTHNLKSSKSNGDILNDNKKLNIENIKLNTEKKQIPLRITQGLWNDLSAWADDEFRSLNGQIEYLLTECVRRRKRNNNNSNNNYINDNDNNNNNNSKNSHENT